MYTLNDMILYEKNFKIGIKTKEKRFFYYLDYDERHADINMNFQHAHTYYEIFILLDDKACHFIEGLPFEVQFGDIVLVKPGRLHKTEYPGGKCCKRLIINFDYLNGQKNLLPFYEHILSIFDAEIPIFRFDKSCYTEIFDDLNSLFLAAYKEEEELEIAAFHTLLNFIRTLYLSRSKNRYMNRIELNAIEKKIYDITSYIHANYQNDLSLSAISGQFYMNSYYLSHKFKEISGFTLRDYITMTRLSNARSLLIKEEKKITEIAFSCGFKSISQFNRSFQKFVETTPKEYRKRHRGASISD